MFCFFIALGMSIFLIFSHLLILEELRNLHAKIDTFSVKIDFLVGRGGSNLKCMRQNSMLTNFTPKPFQLDLTPAREERVTVGR